MEPIIFDEAYKLWSSSLCSLLQPPATSIFQSPNILLSTLFSNTHSLCSCLSVADQVSHTYQIKGDVTVLHILIFWFYREESRDSSVCIELGYGLDDRGSRVRFSAVIENFSFNHRVQNGSGAHLASYPMGTRGSFIGGKAAGAWSWPLTSIQFRGQRMRGAIPLLPQYAFMAWCSVKKSRGITLNL
jgi:hypothetical protein